MTGFSKLQWMDAVRRCGDIPPMQRMVIQHIGDTANRDGCQAWRANDVIVAELGVNKDTVAVARKAAAKRGLWVETAPARGGRNGGKSAEYRLIVPTDLIRRSPDDLAKWSGIDTEMVRNPTVNGPELTGKWSGVARTPSGISSGTTSGLSSGDSPQPDLEPDPWGDEGKQKTA